MIIMNKVFLFNATGMQGQAIAQKLIKSGYKIVTPVRSEDKSRQMKLFGYEAFVTDFSKGSLIPQLKRADKAVIQVPAQISPEAMILLAKTYIDAIKESGCPQSVFVISSIVPEEYVGVRSVDARVTIKNYAQEHLPSMPIFSTTEYLENFSNAYREPIEKYGIIPMAIPPGHLVNYLSWNDLAKYVEAALQTDKLEGKLYRIGGNEAIDGNNLAIRLGNLLGKNIKCVPITYNELAGVLTPILGEDIAKDYAEFYEYQGNLGHKLLNPDTATIRGLLGIKLDNFEEWAKQAFK